MDLPYNESSQSHPNSVLTGRKYHLKRRETKDQATSPTASSGVG